MASRLANAVVILAWLAFASTVSAIMYYLTAPSVAAVRPELYEIGFWTAMFSGRFASWLWLHHPVAAAVSVYTMTGLAALFVIWGVD